MALHPGHRYTFTQDIFLCAPGSAPLIFPVLGSWLHCGGRDVFLCFCSHLEKGGLSKSHVVLRWVPPSPRCLYQPLQCGVWLPFCKLGSGLESRAAPGSLSSCSRPAVKVTASQERRKEGRGRKPPPHPHPRELLPSPVI